ncbi:MAG: hypothetical protein LUC17_01305 [Oscillospiraceae bacterium]|nr:hypothetical protein [Oscillospiraceae bacterium]
MGKSKLEKRICELCGKEFQPHNKNQVICSEEHYIPCPICGTPMLWKSNMSKTCSKQCSIEQRKRTCLEKYGCSTALNDPSRKEANREKAEKTMLDRYGVKHPLQNKQIKQKAEDTLMMHYGVSTPMKNTELQEKSKKTSLEKYGVEHPQQSEVVKQKTKKTCNEKYGVDSPGQSSEIRERQTNTFLSHYGKDVNPNGSKELTKKRQDTCQEKYGKSSYTQTDEYKEISKKHSLKKYGVSNPMQNEDIKQKVKNTNLKRYGVENPMQSEEIKQRMVTTVQNKYGVNSVLGLNEIRDKIKETNLEKYGVPWYCMTEECKYLNGRTISKFNYNFQEELSRNGIETELEFRIENRYYDFHIKNTNILLELNPTITHTTAFNIYDNSLSGKPKNYHLVKTKLATDNRYRCINIWDWDNYQKIINTLQEKTTIYARKCDVKEVDIKEASKFLNNYHFQGSCRNQLVIYGLYYNNELISLMSFGKPRYNKNYDWELLRYCTKSIINVVGGASKLFKTFVRNNKGTIISYCDMSKFSGSLYSTLGFTLQTISKPTKHWSKKSNHITDNLLRQRGFDQLFGTNYGKGISNEELMIQNKWLPVYDCGQATYVYTLEEN